MPIVSDICQGCELSVHFCGDSCCASPATTRCYRTQVQQSIPKVDDLKRTRTWPYGVRAPANYGTNNLRLYQNDPEILKSMKLTENIRGGDIGRGYCTARGKPVEVKLNFYGMYSILRHVLDSIYLWEQHASICCSQYYQRYVQAFSGTSNCLDRTLSSTTLGRKFDVALKSKSLMPGTNLPPIQMSELLVLPIIWTWQMVHKYPGSSH